MNEKSGEADCFYVNYVIYLILNIFSLSDQQDKRLLTN